MTQSNRVLDVSATIRRVVRTIGVGALLLDGASFVLGACSAPTELRPDGEIPMGRPITLRVSAPPAVLVHEQALLIVHAVNEKGLEVALPQPLVWSSSDSTVMSVASDGIVTGVRRGSAAITVNAGSARATINVSVRARVRIATEYADWNELWALAVGDSLQFTAHYVDVDGELINETPTATWASSNPAAVTVSASGLVIAMQPRSSATIVASTVDGRDSAHVSVSDVIAELSATIRFAHTAIGVGPVTFIPSGGAPVRLSFGESVERPIRSGTLFVKTDGFPAGHPTYQGLKRWAGVLRAGDNLSLYAVGDTRQMFLSAAWGTLASVPADSAFVRFVQGSAFSVLYVRPLGAALTGLPELSYFDPHDVSEYYRRPKGDFDIILRAKNPSTLTPIGPEVRFRAAAPVGRAITYVIAGDTPQTARIFAFTDR